MLGLGNSLARGGVLSGLTNNYSLEFDGSSAYVATSSFESTFQDSFTFSVWLKPADGQRYQNFIGTRSGNDEWECLINADGTIRFDYRVDSNEDPLISDSAVFSDGQEDWHHVVGIVDKSVGSYGQMYIYVNSVLITATTYDGNLDDDSVVMGDYSNTNGLFIGTRNNNGSIDSPYIGNIDEVALWDTALSAGDISALYSARGTANLNDDGNSSSLQAWWRMGDGVLDDFNLIADQVNPTLGSELITDDNSGLNDSIGDWGVTGGTTAESVTTAPYSGTHHLSLHTATSSNGTAYLDLDSLVTNGNTYKISFWSRHTGTGTGGLNSGWKFILNEAGEGTGSSEKDFGELEYADTTYVFNVHYFVAVAKSRYFVALERGDGTGGLFLDLLSLKQVNGNPGIMTSMASDDIVKDTP